MDYESELQLCKEFLREDQRNFHCWNYRRAIHERSGFPSEKEFEYSTEKIQENFSNYSAFHHRSIYLSHSGSANLPNLLEIESAVIENAIYTEPDDQSAWWYQQFLFSWALKQFQEQQEDLQIYISSLEKQIVIVNSLLEIEPTSRWAMNSLIFLISQLQSTLSANQTFLSPTNMTDYLQKRRQLLEDLCSIDAIHTNRYRYLLQIYQIN
jgi:geranylgeranyl transferase type-2 subunit alpha